jgi:hypothetical protein
MHGSLGWTLQGMGRTALPGMPLALWDSGRNAARPLTHNGHTLISGAAKEDHSSLRKSSGQPSSAQGSEWQWQLRPGEAAWPGLWPPPHPALAVDEASPWEKGLQTRFAPFAFA